MNTMNEDTIPCPPSESEHATDTIPCPPPESEHAPDTIPCPPTWKSCD